MRGVLSPRLNFDSVNFYNSLRPYCKLHNLFSDDFEHSFVLNGKYKSLVQMFHNRVTLGREQKN